MDRLALDTHGCRPLQMVYNPVAIFRCFSRWIWAQEYLLRSFVRFPSTTNAWRF